MLAAAGRERDDLASPALPGFPRIQLDARSRRAAAAGVRPRHRRARRRGGLDLAQGWRARRLPARARSGRRGDRRRRAAARGGHRRHRGLQGRGATGSIVPRSIPLPRCGSMRAVSWHRTGFGTAYEFATCNRADFDTVVEVRDATGRSVLAYNDDYCARQSDLAWRAPSSGTYRVRVRGYGSSSGSFTLAY